MPDLANLIKPKLVSKLKTAKKAKTIPNFLTLLDKNKYHQSSVWADKTYTVNPQNYVFTTIQERFTNKFINSLSIPKNGVAVDIGCFIGEKLWQLNKTNSYLGIGIDIAVPALVAAQKIDIYGHKFIAADLENLPFKDSSIDLMLAFDVIEHLSHPEKGISEISRVLKPGGKILLHFPIIDNKYSLFWLKQQFFPTLSQKDYDNVGHTKERMPNSLKTIQLLEKNNLFATKKIYYNSFLVHFFDRELNLILGSIYKLLQFDKSVPKTSYQQNKNNSKLRVFYGKYIVPIFELLSLPDIILNKLNVGNTLFVLAEKKSVLSYYKNNLTYSKFLNRASPSDFSVYTEFIIKYSQVGDSFLDVGCGSGNVVDYVSRQKRQAFGVEISLSSLKLCKTKKGKYSKYDGSKLPFKNSQFKVVGSWNVLEHVDSVTNTLSEMSRVLKPHGYLIVGSPNFHSITNSFHHKTRGLTQKLINFFKVVGRLSNYLFGGSIYFEKIRPVVNKEFCPDDDAVNIINMVEMFNWAKIHNYKIVYSQGSLFKNNTFLDDIRRKTPFKYFFGGVFVVMQKI